MLPYLSDYLVNVWGPFRLLGSHAVLIFLGAMLAGALTWLLLPRLWRFLPHDQGKAFVKDSQKAKGKPTAAGIIMVSIFTLISLLVVPLNWHCALMIVVLFAIMLTGFGDDMSAKPWGQLIKGTLDFILSVAAAICICGGKDATIWLPFFKGAGVGGSYIVSVWVYVPLAACVLWISINAVNCSDGVDGLAGSLALLTLFFMGTFLYGVIGHYTVSKYLLLPHYQDGARWAIMMFTACGMLAGYLWHNASPSSVLMGDAGSRFLGLLIGVSTLASGNPFMLLVCAPILLANGGTGLVKIVLLRFLRRLGYDVRLPLSRVPNPINPKNFATDEEAERQIGLVKVINRYRFPIHDQCRKNWNWSDTQVLVRFMLLQGMITPLLVVLFIKLR